MHRQAIFTGLLFFGIASAAAAQEPKSMKDDKVPPPGLSRTIKATKRPGVNLSLECKSVEATSERGRFPGITAALSDADQRDGFTVTGGGCEQLNPDNNFAFIASRPSGQGWYCHTGDLPGAPANVQVRATVIGCRVISAK